MSLLWKLEYRFRRFNGANQSPLQLKAARSAFSLMVHWSIYPIQGSSSLKLLLITLTLTQLFSVFIFQVRVVDSLIDTDFHAISVMQNLSDFIAELVTDGELLLARAIRSKFIEKYEAHRTRLLPELDFGRLVLTSNGNKCKNVRNKLGALF
jgi:hypothetical protein